LILDPLLKLVANLQAFRCKPAAHVFILEVPPDPFRNSSSFVEWLMKQE
jgi:hypothetical protein